VLIATACGVGFAPFAPGTIGSLAALPLWWFLLSQHTPLVQLLVLVAAAVVTILIVDRVCRRNQVDDDQAIVLDEVLGMLIALFAAPRNVTALAAAFVLFRLFDIAKPWPVSWAERHLRGGFGVVMDDVIAGVLAAGVLKLSLVALDRWGSVVGA
jgi:phosphatidylglycerophosphatase A